MREKLFLGKMRIIFIFSLISYSLGEKVILNLNLKEPVYVTSEKFLSFTLDPKVILSGDLKTHFLSSNLERSINIAKAFSPAYVRFAGPQSNSFTFENIQLLEKNQTNSDHSLTENLLNSINQWAEKSDLNLITCIGQQFNENSEDASSNSQQAWNLISLSDQMGYNTSWQLGYECQSRCDLHGEKLGKDVKRLRRMLNAFPRYSTSLIVGPDVTAFKQKQQQQYLHDYFQSAGSALSAITWHPDFYQVSLNNDDVIIDEKNLSTEKKLLEGATGQLLSDKPLWIAESKEEECKNQFIGALVWARRLGNAAKVGAQVLMRQPDNSNLFKPTPDFWVSLLHKKLVGPEVFNLNIQSGNQTHVHFFCQCTKSSSKYEKGSLTIFGINLTPNKMMANLKGYKIKEAYEYILLPGFDTLNRMFAETVLLNDKLLTLKNENEIPDIEPIKIKNEKGVTLNLPSGGIGFWIIPNLKMKICRSHEVKGVNKQKLKKLAHILQDEKEDLSNEELTDISRELKTFLSINKQDLTNTEEKQLKRTRREAKNINNLLNHEMFLQGENKQQYRTIRRAKAPENKQELDIDPEKAIIIDSDENISKEDVSIEDGSGAHIDIDKSSTFTEAKFEKVKRDSKKMEKNYSKSTERIPLSAVGPRPEIVKESSTENMSINRDTRENKTGKKIATQDDSSKNSEYDENTSNPSRKRVRNIFGAMGRALEETKVPIRNPIQSPVPILKLAPAIIPPITTSADQIRQRVSDARVKIQSMFQNLANSIKFIRPLTVKRETLFAGQTPIERIKELQKRQEARNSETLRTLKEGIEKLKIMQTSNNLKTFDETKLKEFVGNCEEQLLKLRNSLQQKQDEILENYKSKSMKFLKKNNNNDVKSLFNNLGTDNDFRKQYSNLWNSLQKNVIKRDIKLPNLLSLIKIMKTEEDDDSEEDITKREFLKTLTRQIINHLTNYPLILLGNDLSDVLPTKENIANILEEESDYSAEDSSPCDELSSEEDENWNYKDTKYKRTVRSPQKQLSENLIKGKNDETSVESDELLNEDNEKYSRKRRDAENDDAFEEPNIKSLKKRKKVDFSDDKLNHDEDGHYDSADDPNLNSDVIQTPPKRRKSKRRKNRINNQDYDPYSSHEDFHSEYFHPQNQMQRQNYWSYPLPFYDYPFRPYEDYFQQTSYPNNYNYFDYRNPASDYYSISPLLRRRRQVNEISKTTESPINKNQIINENSDNEKGDFVENSENCLWETSINCHSIEETTMNYEKESLGIEIEDIENSSEIPITDNRQNNLESLMNMEKIYDKFVPSMGHRIHSRKMMENDKSNSTFFQDVTKTIENIFTYFSNMTHSA